MNYEDYVKRVTTKGMRWRAVGHSPDMKRYIKARAVVDSGGRKNSRGDGDIDTKILVTIESIPERLIEPPKIEDLPEELRPIFEKVSGQMAKMMKGQKQPAKFLAVEIHPDDFDSDEPRLNANNKIASSVISKKFFLSVPDQPDHWRMRHEENRDAWVEFEFLGAIDMSQIVDEEPDDAATSAASDLFARLGSNSPKH